MAVHEPLSPEDERLLPLVVAIADGAPVAWPPVSTPLVERLQRLERLVRGHDAVRSSASGSARPHETLLTEARRRNAAGSDTLRVQWGSLIVFEKIGRGSFGDVYRAWDPRLDREVALKLIPEDGSAGAAPPVIEEGRLLARVRHPNVMTVYGADRCDGRTGIWTEYIRGETLAAEVARRGPLPADEAIRIGVDVCAALGAVHAAGLLHRDVKAQNILRDTGGRIVLGDFGTGVAMADDARMSDPQIAGTPLYLAPEVIEGTPATVASDVYGVGVLLYFLSTATFPVRGSTLADIRSAHARGARVPLREVCPDVPDALARVVDTLLATNPDERYQDAAAAEAALRRTLPQPATGQGSGRRLAMAAIAVSCIGVAALSTVAWWRQGRTGTADARSNAAPFAVKAGDWILVSEFDNHTGESVLDGTLRNAIERELEYSDFVRVAQRDRIEDALKLLRRRVDSPLSKELAVALAQRDGGLRAVMSGGIAKDPGGYALRFDVVDPATGMTVTTRSDRAATPAEVLPRVRAQTLLLREALGEPASSIDRSRDAFRRSPLPTLKAMSLATQVRTMVSLRPTGPVATWMALEKLGRQIMQEDDSFAYGPLVVAWSLSNQGRRPEGVVHAERALQLAGNATPQERYFILGTVHRFRGRADYEGDIDRGEVEKAVAALEALFALQPDHYAVRNNLRGAYRVLGRHRDIAWMNQRLADARPWSVTENLAVARQLLRDGNVEGARRYGARAEAALSPATAAPEVDDAASVRLFAAYIAWAQDDAEATIQALDRAAASAGTLAPPERRQLAVRLAAMYAAVGRLQDAQRTVDAVQPGPNDVTAVISLAIARAALYEEDAPGLLRLREFMATRWREPLPSTAPALSARRAPFLIEAGLLDDAERDLQWFKRRTAQTAEWAPAVPRRQFQPFEATTRAAITLKRGRAAEAVAVLRQQMPVLRNGSPWVFGPGGWHTQYAEAKLAEGLEIVGKLPDAIAVLEEAMSDRVALTIGNTPHRWLRANAELARLYRKSGQEAKAREIETRLARLLIFADPDHPLALALKSAR